MIHHPAYKALKQRMMLLEKQAEECKQTEKRIRHLNAVLSAIRNVNQLITKEKDPRKLIRGVCEHLIKYRGYHNAWIILTDSAGTISESAEAGLGTAFLSISKQIRQGLSIYCCQKVMSDTPFLTIADPLSVCKDCPLSHMYKNRGAFATRLAYGDIFYGILTVSVPLIFSTDEEEHYLFKDVADDIAFALHNIEVEAERKAAEDSLRKARDELEYRVKERTNELELLSSRLMNAQEEERKRIAGDLHDGIGQSLSAAKFMVENALEQLAEENSNMDLSVLKPLVPMLQKASEDVRTIVMNLRPSILDDLGILATIGWFCRQFQAVYTDIRIDENICIQEKDVSEDLKTIIFRILQEAMNNVAKHSHATRVHLYLGKQESCIELCISDNGCGFDMKASGRKEHVEKGFGITSMKERTELSGGTFYLHAEPTKGTVVRASWHEISVL